MTIDDFKLMMLYKVLDYDIPDWAHWLVANQNGDLMVYDHCPHTTARGEWAVEDERSFRTEVIDPKHCSDLGIAVLRINIPDEIDWTECKINLKPDEVSF